MDYIKSQISSLSKAGSTVCVCSPLHPFPAHLLSAKGSCHGDCTQFGGSRSVIPNKSFTHSVSFPFILHTRCILQWREFSETDRLLFLHLSRSLNAITNTAAHVSSLLVYKDAYARRAHNHRLTFLHLSNFIFQLYLYSFSPELQHLF